MYVLPHPIPDMMPPYHVADCLPCCDDEPLCDMAAGGSAWVRCAPQYHAMGLPGAAPGCWLRAGALERLERAGEWLGAQGVGLIVWDAWRSVEAQQALFDAYAGQLRREHPHLSPEELITATRRFVALPSLDPRRPSPHVTGGAVDVTLCDARGQALWMGTEFDDFSPAAATRYYEEREAQTALTPYEIICRDRRRLLFHAMQEARFVNFAGEWWHYEYGTRRWAEQMGHAVAYGPTGGPQLPAPSPKKAWEKG